MKPVKHLNAGPGKLKEETLSALAEAPSFVLLSGVGFEGFRV